MRGKFITFEGGDGAGKTTQIGLLAETLERAGKTPIVTREPGGTALAEEIRDWVLHHSSTVDPETEVLLMFAARSHHTSEIIEPALESGRWVLCDRYADASYAYQGGGRGVLIRELEFLAQFAHRNLWPDLTIYLDAPVDRAFARIRDREQDRIEQSGREFFERVRYKYLEMAENDSRISVVDANKELSTVQDDLRSLLSSFLSEQK